MYDYFPKITYNKQSIVDISRRFIVDYLKEKYNTDDIYYIYTIQNWISIDNLAYDVYGDSKLEWLIRVMNNIDNIFDNVTSSYIEGEYLPEANQIWLLRQEELEEYIKLKYPNKNTQVGSIDYTYIISGYPHHYTKDNINYQYFELNPLLSDNYLNNLKCFKIYLEDNFGYNFNDTYANLANKLSKCTINNLVTKGYYISDTKYIQAGSFDIKDENINPIKIETEIYKDLGCSIVSNTEYENNLNEKRRDIKIIYPALVEDIESMVKELFQ